MFRCNNIRYACDAHEIFCRGVPGQVRPTDTYLGWYVEHARGLRGGCDGGPRVVSTAGEASVREWPRRSSG